MKDIGDLADIGPKSLVAIVFTVAVLFGFMPGFIVRLIVLLLPDELRRKEVIGELYGVSRWERPTWVFQQVEVCLFEGIGERLAARRQRRLNEEIADWETELATIQKDSLDRFLAASTALDLARRQLTKRGLVDDKRRLAQASAEYEVARSVYVRLCDDAGCEPWSTARLIANRGWR